MEPFMKVPSLVRHIEETITGKDVVDERSDGKERRSSFAKVLLVGP